MIEETEKRETEGKDGEDGVLGEEERAHVGNTAEVDQRVSTPTNGNDGSGGDTEDDDEESAILPSVVRNGPCMTAAVERLELAHASDRERAMAHADLHGLPPPGTAYHDEVIENRRAMAVEGALGEIPPEERTAVIKAQLAFPFLFSSSFHVRPFLHAEENDPRRAARRIVRYWEGREQLLGDDAFSPEAFASFPLTDRDRGRLYSRGFKSTSDPKVNEALRASVVKNLSSWLLGKIEAVEREIDGISPKRKAALLDARQQQPELVDEDQMIAFLESEEYDPSRAARRLASYWDMKYYLFGDEGALKGADEDLSAFSEECHEELKEGIAYVLPGVDAFGRKLIMIRADKFPVGKAAQKRLLKVIWVCVKETMTDGRARRNGLVYICYVGNYSPLQANNIEFLSRVVQLVFHCTPLRMCALHDCVPPKGRWFRMILLPFVKWLMTRDYRMRFKLHEGEKDEVLAALEAFGIRKEQLPSVLGGYIDEDLYTSAFVEEKLLTKNEEE